MGEFLINLTAGVLGILIVLWIERNRRPRLFMKVGVPGTIDEQDVLKRQPTTFLKVQIHNTPMPRWLRWVYDREPALACAAWITFFHLDGHKVYERDMVTRWSETPEPEPRIVKTEERTVAMLPYVPNTVDIPSGRYANVDVVARLKVDDECYGWNNESYLHGWRHPSWRLDKGRYLARIRVEVGGREFVDVFLVVNDVQWQDFRLEPARPELKGLVL